MTDLRVQLYKKRQQQQQQKNWDSNESSDRDSLENARITSDEEDFQESNKPARRSGGAANNRIVVTGVNPKNSPRKQGSDR